MRRIGKFFTGAVAGLVFSAATLLLATSCNGHTSSAGAQDTAGSPVKPEGIDGEFEPIFLEEFDGTTLDTSHWTTCYWWDENGCTNLSNRNRQWYQRDNVSVADGVLVLTAREERVTGFEGRRFDYTSGIVTTGRYDSESSSEVRFEANKGIFEMRARLPAGKGLWPAFWMLPSTLESKPEIDIMELLGHRTRQLELHFHYRNGNGESERVGTDVMTYDLTEGWHVYGLDWSADRIVWYLDGKEVWRYDDPRYIPDEPMYLLINLAVGGEWPGDPDRNTEFPASMEVDYVRAWKRTSE